MASESLYLRVRKEQIVNKKSDLYRVSYEEIEKQIIDLSYDISFDDINFDSGVHSLKIANLILGCARQIESISKDLYFDSIDLKFENDERKKRDKVYYDYDCLYKILTDWDLENREVNFILMSATVSKSEYKIYKPFKHTLKKKNKKDYPLYTWNEAYQALKHDYLESITQYANLYNLVSIASMLFLLIGYYSISEQARIIRKPELEESDLFVYKSRLFSLNTVSFCKVSNILNKIDLRQKSGIDECSIIVKYTDEFVRKIETQDGISSVTFQVSQSPEGKIEQFEEVEYEILLNKGQEIYPNLSK
ncbi:hypothetical protein [Pseudolactococcus reticulitermitis]|uniref:Uncharacterized protein n=1 Tax=Pseudolactococcus reticulitermitis TaxID=2025039 RepID=A0A224WYD3_9LACT|nr:hypothetical protein [Lactococcus reticulitermitis]GAX47127.1 hypothetical protein RsY01_709 [Lactococcus reticulitermitis]